MDGVVTRMYDNGFEFRYLDSPQGIIRAELVVGVGAGYESDAENGISHFVEHTVFRGGTDRLSPAQSDLVVASLGYANAGTIVDFTKYDGEFLPEDLNVFLEYVSDVSVNARFDPEIVEQERRRIIAEIGQYRNNPRVLFNDAFVNFMLKQSPLRRGSSLGILGLVDNVRAMQRKDLLSFHRRWNKRANSVLYMIGPLPDGIEETVGEYFGNDDGVFEPFTYGKEPVLEGVKRGEVSRAGAERATAVLAWQIPPEEDYEASLRLKVAKRMLVGDFTSGLHRELSVERGLTYSVGSHQISHFGEGVLGIQTDVDPDKIDEVESVVIDTIRKMQEGDIDIDHLERVKKKRAFTLTRALDDPDSLLGMMIKERQTGVDLTNEANRVRALTVEDIQQGINYLDLNSYIAFNEIPA